MKTTIFDFRFLALLVVEGSYSYLRRKSKCLEVFNSEHSNMPIEFIGVVESKGITLDKCKVLQLVEAIDVYLVVTNDVPSNANRALKGSSCLEWLLCSSAAPNNTLSGACLDNFHIQKVVIEDIGNQI